MTTMAGMMQSRITWIILNFLMPSMIIKDVRWRLRSNFVNTLEDNIRERGVMSWSLSERAKVEISARLVGILRALHIGQWQSEPHQQHQNPANAVIRHWRQWQTLVCIFLVLLGLLGYFVLCTLRFFLTWLTTGHLVAFHYRVPLKVQPRT
jgi:hypothetical protein